MAHFLFLEIGFYGSSVSCHEATTLKYWKNIFSNVQFQSKLDPDIFRGINITQLPLIAQFQLLLIGKHFDWRILRACLKLNKLILNFVKGGESSVDAIRYIAIVDGVHNIIGHFQTVFQRGLCQTSNVNKALKAFNQLASKQ